MKLLVEIQDNVYKSLKNNRGTAIENVMAIAAVIGGQPLPDDCEILTKEAYADVCVRASGLFSACRKVRIRNDKETSS